MKADKNTNADQFLNELLARLNVEAGRLALNHLKYIVTTSYSISVTINNLLQWAVN